MKKISLLFVALLLLLLCACGSDSPSETPMVSLQPELEAAAALPSESPAPSAEPELSMKDVAAGYVDDELSALIAVIGEPESSEYVPSCLGSGEDGILTYDGFTVYTYRENDSEIIRIVD